MSVPENPSAALLVSPLDGAMFSVWLHGGWRWLTSKMTTEQREAAWEAVQRYHDVEIDPDDRLSEGWAWWRDDAPAVIYATNGELIRCVKCSSTKATTRYQRPRESYEVRFVNGERNPAWLPQGEYLLHRCDTCRYEWVTPCEACEAKQRGPRELDDMTPTGVRLTEAEFLASLEDDEPAKSSSVEAAPTTPIVGDPQ